MKKSEIQAIVESGQPVLFAEYRGGGYEEFTFFDKTNKRQEIGRGINHALETSSGKQIKLQERPGEGVTVLSYKAPAKKGDRVLVILRSWVMEKGNAVARGEVHVCES